MVSIILASKSKIRKEMLDRNDIITQVEPSKVDEDIIKEKAGGDRFYTIKIFATAKKDILNYIRAFYGLCKDDLEYIKEEDSPLKLKNYFYHPIGYLARKIRDETV